MIKCEVVFDGDYIECNNHELYISCESFRFCIVGHNDEFDSIEQAIKWCLEN